jgi:hypothetical protein
MDLRYLLRLDDYDELPPIDDLSELAAAFTKINDSFMDEVGFSEEFSAIHETKKALALYMIMYMEGQRSLSAIIKSHERKLERIQRRDDAKGSFESSVAGVEKWLGSVIDTRRVSVRRFYTYIDMIKRENKVTLQNNG